ncbi:hypothetical protein TpMuguga_03g00219 [Theileria parva strain Muguga]|uniref:SfiI-subtelomeric related protein family member n=1 Tax=Theileria parva TaxID=5875 RepID=Q4N0D0_THEPA|nr:uncharacterized protein TpMuguga_03g00219 [Theileria parva strain Muguga]EAN30954.1 hypothetical protein TpMuguga_03g00219 [Theileria parva strain Muguga]|eukprot:XP_763237.1 hypothetical protein [Theileria parva strain Muguga]
MKFGIFTFIAILISCPYKSAHGADGNGSSQSTGATTGTTSPGAQVTTPATGTTPGSKTGEKTGGTGLTLDIKKNKGSNEFKYSERGKCRLFTAQGTHTFSKIVTGNTDVWKSTGDDHAVKVLLKGKGDKKKHLAISFKSGKFLVLYRDGKGKPWNDITSSKDDITKFKFYGEGEKELTTADYKIDIGLMFCYLVIFNSEGKCKKIKFGDKEIWKPDDSDTKFKKFKFFSVDLDSNDCLIINNYGEHKRIEITKPTTTGTTPGTGTNQGSGSTPSTNPSGQTGTSTTEGPKKSP